MREKAKTYALLVILGVPLVFHMLFRTCGRYVYGGCRRSLLGSFLVGQGGVFAELVRSTEFLFTAIVAVLLVFALLSSARDRLPF